MKMKSVILAGLMLLLSGTLFAQGKGSAPTSAPTANPNAQEQNPPTMGQQPTPAAKGSTTGPMTEKEVISELKKQGADQLQKDLTSPRRGI